MPEVVYRPLQPQDIPALGRVYQDAVEHTAGPAYTEQQIRAWASFADELTADHELIQNGTTIVATTPDGEVIAFGVLHPDDYIALLYSASQHNRVGHGSAICAELESIARSRGVRRLRVVASEISLGFFRQHGFVREEIERCSFNGVKFERYRMAKRIG